MSLAAAATAAAALPYDCPVQDPSASSSSVVLLLPPPLLLFIEGCS
jgi:hypothetical protein